MTAKATTTTVKSLSSRTADVKVTLTPKESYGMVTWTVTNTETGHVYGTIDSRQGRTDLTPRANTRRDSKVKTLWAAANAKGRPDFIDYSSRAAALRAIVFTY